MKPLSRRAVLGVLAAAGAAYGLQAAWTGRWPFGSQRRAVAALLGGDAPGWLRDAELASWEPAANSEARRWFATAPVTRQDFLAWAVASGLAVLRGERLPASAWVLPDGVHMSHWTDAASVSVDMVEARGRGAATTLLARWNAGRLYLVAYPDA